jgi:radical SAM protein with 4Fe4S-binding SPASM domain
MQLANNVEIMKEVDDWLGRITEDILPKGYTLQKKSPKITRRPCVQLWHLTIHPDGDMQLCSCRNVFADPGFHIGNIKEITLLEAHEKTKEVLIRWESGNIPMSCQKCSMYCDPAYAFLGRWRDIWQKNH